MIDLDDNDRLEVAKRFGHGDVNSADGKVVETVLKIDPRARRRRPPSRRSASPDTIDFARKSVAPAGVIAK